MSRSTISTFQLFAMFPDEESARVYLEGRIWIAQDDDGYWFRYLPRALTEAQTR